MEALIQDATSMNAPANTVDVRNESGLDTPPSFDQSLMKIKDEFLKPRTESTDTRYTNPSKRAHDADDSLEATGKQDHDKKRDKTTRASHTFSVDLVSLCKNYETCGRGDQCEDLGPVCHNFTTLGYCKCGIKCRFATGHVDADNKNLRNEALIAEHAGDVMNIVSQETQKITRSKKMVFARTDLFYSVWDVKKKAMEEKEARELQERRDRRELGVSVVDAEAVEVVAELVCVEAKADSAVHEVKVERAALDTSILKPTNREKKRVDFRGKTYLAPLTTVGNLPFRRICKGFGVDITCGEMALSTNLLAGQQSEWALLRRHKSEDIFGVQVCGSNTRQMVQTAELISKTCDVNFIDINSGCPIDLVFKQGAGSALLDKPTKLVEMLSGMSSVIDCDLTIKIRTGIHDAKPTAHKLLNRFQHLDIGLVTLHGRSRQQRYSKLADWSYISEVAKLSETVPVFGNGDVMSFQEYQAHLEESSISGVMIGRGALIKPWIFKEIKERKVYDISSSERLDMLREFGNNGLEQFGSDTMGVNQTRKFMCEWLSYLCRYVPVGLLETRTESNGRMLGLQTMNARPAAFVGRDELETLMGSGIASDWIKISELVLGKAPADFHFTPK